LVESALRFGDTVAVEAIRSTPGASMVVKHVDVAAVVRVSAVP